jgi:hypothetical protein
VWVAIVARGADARGGDPYGRRAIIDALGRRGGGARRVVVGSVLLVGVLLLLALPWLRHAWTALPADDAPEDAWLILWVLDWVRHALATSPGTLFDPPLNWPAPGQLAGSEHFLASQLLYVPLRWLTSSGVAAANLTALASYVLAALGMYALLVVLGIEPAAAFVVALAYAFGWQGRPGRLHILQGQHFYLPLGALVLHRLRDRPTPWRALAVGLVVAAGLLSSYHMAVYLTVGMTIWGTAEWLRAGDARAAYLGRAIGAGLVAVALLVVVSIPYLTRPEAHGDTELAYSRWKMTHLESDHDELANADALFVVRTLVGCAVGGGQGQSCIPVDWLADRQWTLAGAGALPPFALAIPLLVLVGFAEAARAASPRRWVFLAGTAFVAAGVLLAGPARCTIGGIEVPLPPALVAASPARFIRVPDRALVLAFFGAALLMACGLDVALRRLGRPARAVVVALLVVSIGFRIPLSPGVLASTGLPRTPWEALERWGRLSPVRYLENPALADDAPGYAALEATVSARGAGPLLDLPVAADGTAVVGQTLHRQPSICFYTGYLPAHVSMVESLIDALPDGAALDDLVDMTGLRWIVLRPAREWPSPEERARYADALRAHPRVRRVEDVGGFSLVELDPTSHHPDWFRSLAAGPRHGFSALGTPLVRLPATADGGVRLRAPARAVAGQPVSIDVALANRSIRGWPAAAPARPGVPASVHLELRWKDAAASSAPEVFELRRDVPAGETLEQHVTTAAPARPGTYRVEIALRQVDGADMSSPGNPARADVTVGP